MPLPTPTQEENRAEFISRCVGSEVVQDEYSDNDQRLAVCVGQWDRSQERGMSVNDKLLRAVGARGRRRTEFGHGIAKADRYVRTMLDDFGSDACYRYAATKETSFDDLLKKAARTLVYSNPEMEVEQKWPMPAKEFPNARNMEVGGDDVEMPKNTLMVFRHVLTSDRTDRDGDVLRTAGAEVDPKMLLLWQHMHTMPIGKMLAVAEQTDRKLTLISAIVDVNGLCHDAAVLIDSGMGRFSHGFNALEFDEIAGEDKEAVGFDVKRFEIMEESLVSVPANVDAETEEVLLSLVEGGKLTSPLMKLHGKRIREGRPTAGTGITFREEDGELAKEITCRSFDELKAAHDEGLIGGKKNENEPGAGEEAGEGRTGGPSKKADEGAAKAEEAGDAEVKDTAPREGLENSYEWIEYKLRRSIKPFLIGAGVSIADRDWAYLAGTYDDYAIMCVEKDQVGVEDEFRHFQADWKMEGKEPKFQGEPKQVNIEVTTEVRELSPAHGKKSGGGKSGRALSKANEGKITEARSKVDEVVGMEATARPAKALLREASAGLGEVLEALGTDDEPKGSTIRQCIVRVMMEASSGERQLMRSLLDARDEGERQSMKVKQYNALRGK